MVKDNTEPTETVEFEEVVKEAVGEDFKAFSWNSLWTTASHEQCQERRFQIVITTRCLPNVRRVSDLLPGSVNNNVV
jgi:hypothetical protein